MYKVNLFLASVVWLVVASPVSSAENPVTYEKLYRCNFSEGMILQILKYQQDVLTDTEREVLALQDAATRQPWIGRHAREAALSFYCGKFKKILPRLDAAQRQPL